MKGPAIGLGEYSKGQAHSRISAKRGLGWLCRRDVRYGPWLLLKRGARRVDDGHEPCGHDVLPFRVCPIRSALRLPGGASPRVRDALLPYDDDPLHALTFLTLHQTYESNW